MTAAHVMTINGQAVPGDGHFGVINPATGQVFAQAPECSREQLDVGMAAAERAFPGWRDTPPEVRGDALLRAGVALRSAADEIARLLTQEQGKPLAAALMEVQQTAQWLESSAALRTPVEVVQDDERALIEVARRPLGVVAAITPWNYPLLLMAMKLGPALVAGNCVVLKPSPYTPLATLNVGARIAALLPPGVLNVVSGGNELGGWMTSHPSVRKISFTGSVATGKVVARAAADDLKRCTLELGGNDAAIVLDDADPARIAGGLFWGAFLNAGQVCAGIKRIYVPQSRYAAFLEAIAERARRVVVGDGMADGVEIGPLNNPAQHERVSMLVAQALQAGARAVAGGAPIDRPGYFFQPTVLADASEGMRIVDEEQFGPALPVMPYRSEEEAIARANGTRFGLSGSVWSADPERARAVADRLHCGTTFVNTHLVLEPHVPFGGVGWSGVGVENGAWGLEEFVDIHVRHTRRHRRGA